MRAGPSQEEVRRQNLGALLRYVHVHGATSRAELTSELGLNRSTIGALTADLTSAGLVTEGTPPEAGRAGRAGRPSLVVRPESDRVFAYAVSLEVEQIRAARVGLGGEILDRREVGRPRAQDGPAEVVAPVGALVDELRGAVPAGAQCVGTGVAVHSILRFGAALPPDLPAAAGRVTIGSLADLCALAEHARGTAVGCDNVIYLYGDVGVGAGIIAGGRRVTGHGGYGGEVGHMVVHPGGRPCSCGSRGCWETEVGEAALLQAASREGTAGRDAVLAVIDAASRGDGSAQLAVRQVGEWLGFGVANLVNIFNPEMVIFGGALRDVYLAAAAQVRSRLNSMGLAVCREHVRLRTPKLGADAALIGAAELAFEQLLADPLAE